MLFRSDRIFNCDMTLYYLRWQVDFHCSPGEMADKNIRTDYSKLKMLARIDRAKNVLPLNLIAFRSRGIPLADRKTLDV